MAKKRKINSMFFINFIVIGQIKVGYLVFYNLLQAVFFSIITAIILNEIITNPHGKEH